MDVTSNINLARKWRPKNFATIVGQDLAVRLLKNSLYRNYFCPAYLLAGQRGCGKTTTGRIFAAAVNCEKLEAFTQNPQDIMVPCELCASCIAMQEHRHPDFIEIDAASHTGVDNIRQIIETASFLPQLGRKKIYLIDEAHMLSKAAFNAFLKVLEEPPMTVLFLLATTDVHKIIDTVRSRCFQIFFNAINQVTLVQHLAFVCQEEHIPYDIAALELMVRESDGSVRDALNLVERVRLVADTLTVATVGDTLGYCQDTVIVTTMDYIAQRTIKDLLAYLVQAGFYTSRPVFFWKRLFDCFQLLLHMHYTKENSDFIPFQGQLRACGKQMTIERIIMCMELMNTKEQQFVRTAAQHACIELLLIQFCQDHFATPVVKKVADESEKIYKGTVAQQPQQRHGLGIEKAGHVSTAISDQVVAQKQELKISEEAMLWQRLIVAVEKLVDPLLNSLFKQSRFIENNGTVWKIALPKKFTLFLDNLEKAAPIWKKCLEDVASKQIEIEFICLDESKEQSPAQIQLKQGQANPIEQERSRPAVIKKNSQLDISDPMKWEKTHALLRVFPGSVTQID